MDIFDKILINKTISINYNEIKKNLDFCILNILKNRFENKCSEHGLIKKDSINIIKRSNIYINNFYNSSIIKINIDFECLICNPKQNLIISCKVKDNIKPGIIAYLNPLEIIIPITLHSKTDIFKNFNEGDDIEIKILKSQFKLNDKLIQCIGILNCEDFKDKNNDEDSMSESISDNDSDKEIDEDEDEEDEIEEEEGEEEEGEEEEGEEEEGEDEEGEDEEESEEGEDEEGEDEEDEDKEDELEDDGVEEEEDAEEDDKIPLLD